MLSSTSAWRELLQTGNWRNSQALLRASSGLQDCDTKEPLLVSFTPSPCCLGVPSCRTTESLLVTRDRTAGFGRKGPLTRGCSLKAAFMTQQNAMHERRNWATVLRRQWDSLDWRPCVDFSVTWQQKRRTENKCEAI